MKKVLKKTDKKVKEVKKEIKYFNLAMPKDLWVFLKKLATKEDRTMKDILLELLKNLKKK